MSDERGVSLKAHPDDEFFDSVEIVTVPRYKTSGLSGDEWRVSVVVRLKRKGHVLAERSFSKMQYAVAFLPAMFHEALDHGRPKEQRHEELCFQPGCAEPYVSEYRLKKDWCSRCGDGKESAHAEHRRRFCRTHLRRGDCGLDDADANYKSVSGPGPDMAAGYEPFVTESAVIVVDGDELLGRRG